MHARRTKPLSHMSRTITMRSGSAGSRIGLASASRRVLLRIWGCPSRGSGGGPGHHDLQHALAVIGVLPFGTQRDQLAVEVAADPPAHADDHRLAVQRREVPR